MKTGMADTLQRLRAAAPRALRRSFLLTPLLGLGAFTRSAHAAPEAAAAPPPAPGAAAPLAGTGPAEAAGQGGLVQQSAAWRVTTQGDLAAAYVNVIPTFRQAGGEAARTVADELRERVSVTQFMTGGRTAGAAIAAAIDHVWRNNGDRGGEVLLPAGPPLVVGAPIAARPGVTVRGTGARIEVPANTPGRSFGLFDVDGTDRFTLLDLTLSLSRRAGPAVIRGDASDFSARGLRVEGGRSIWFARGRRARIADMICWGGTNAVGGGGGPDDRSEDVVVTNLQAYDMQDEAIDINFNMAGFYLSGFTFRRCSLARRGEVIDIGGGECRDITIANGLVDCSGSPHRVGGIGVKRNTRNVSITGVDIINGQAEGSVAIRLHNSMRVNIAAVNVGPGFTYGFYSNSGTNEVEWRGGRCDSPLRINGGADVDLDVMHDGGNTESTLPAFTVAAGARRATIRGLVRNRPRAPAVLLGFGRGSTEGCRVLDLQAQGVERAIAGLARTEGLRVSGLRAAAIGKEAIHLADGARDATLRDITVADYSRDAAARHAAIRLGAGCDGAILRDIRTRDSGEEGARTAGPAVAIDGASRGVILDGIVAAQAPAAVAGAERLSGSMVGATVTL